MGEAAAAAAATADASSHIHPAPLPPPPHTTNYPPTFPPAFHLLILATTGHERRLAAHRHRKGRVLGVPLQHKVGDRQLGGGGGLAAAGALSQGNRRGGESEAA